MLGWWWRRRLPRLHLFLLLLLALNVATFFWAATAQGTAKPEVALYLPFDEWRGAGESKEVQSPVLTALCPLYGLPPFLSAPETVLQHDASGAHGSAASFSRSAEGVNLGKWGVTSLQDAANQMTLSLYVRFPASLFSATLLHKRPSSAQSDRDYPSSGWLLGVAVTEWLGTPTAITLRFDHYAARRRLQVRLDAADSAWKAQAWNHVAVVVRPGMQLLFLNGRMVASDTYEYSALESPTMDLVVGQHSSSDTFSLDELRIYNGAFDETNQKQFDASPLSPPPSFSISVNGNTTEDGDDVHHVPYVETTTLEVTNLPSTDTTYSFRWVQVQGLCGFSSLANDTSQIASLTFRGGRTSTFQFQACVQDELTSLSSSRNVRVQSTSNPPILSSQPKPILEAYSGLAAQVEVSLEPTFPAPSYQWQHKIWVVVNNNNETIGNNDTDTNSTKRSWIVSARQAGEEEIQELQWRGIPGATGPRLMLTNVTESMNGTLYRCVISNSKASVFSDEIRLLVAEPPADGYPPDDDGDDDDKEEKNDDKSDDTAMIAAISVSLGVFVCCLLMGAGALIAIVVQRRTNLARQRKKLRKPDFTKLVFIGQSDSFSYSSLSSDQKDGISRFTDLLLAKDRALIDAIIQTVSTTEADRVVKATLPVFHAHDSASLPLILHYITEEVALAKTKDVATLFRSNSIASKMFTLYSRMVALPYIWSVLVVPINELNDNASDMARRKETTTSSGPYVLEDEENEGEESETEKEAEGNESRASTLSSSSASSSSSSSRKRNGTSFLFDMSMEVDPTKMDLDSDAQEVNNLQLWLVAQKLLVTIKKSHHKLPQELRVILRHVQQEVTDAFGEGEENGEVSYKALGGFLFLRFFCPALMAPQVYGLLDEAPHPTAQRQLILLAKIMQNLANGTLPSKKEAFMQRLDSFITTNKSSLSAFYATIIAHDAPSSSSSSSDAIKMGPEIVEDAVMKLYRHVHEQRKKVVEHLEGKEEDVEAAETNRLLQQVLDEVGSPSSFARRA
ncbi:Inhibitory regulator protein BUD2/CLA2 [Balamuthia mandrillaris]